jgi:N-acetylglucosamine-6-phosphate deacetylase
MSSNGSTVIAIVLSWLISQFRSSAVLQFRNGDYNRRVLAITAKRLITPTESIDTPLVLIDDGHIVRFGRRDNIGIPSGAKHQDFPDATIAPGFVDLHIHGGAGHDVMEASDAALEKISSHLAKTGVTSFCPTTVTASVEATLHALEHLGKAVQKQSLPGAQPIGIHLEGPFISAAKCGVHPVSEIKDPSLDLLDRFWQASHGTIKIVTLAPELPGAIEFTGACVAKKIVVSLGHSNADAAATKACIDAGARHATHTFNAMRTLDHREPGILGVVLSDDRVSADIIVDGVHVAPEMVKLFLRAKGAKAVLITDAISATGMPNGRYKLGGFEVEVEGDRCMHNGRLAGSVLTLDRAVRNVMGFAEPSLDDAVRLATTNPARVLASDQGVIARGGRADFVVLNDSGEVVQLFVGGRAV